MALTVGRAPGDRRQSVTGGKGVTPHGGDRWGSRLGFVAATAGSAIGLGNIWRFPSLAAENARSSPSSCSPSWSSAFPP